MPHFGEWLAAEIRQATVERPSMNPRLRNRWHWECLDCDAPGDKAGVSGFYEAPVVRVTQRVAAHKDATGHRIRYWERNRRAEGRIV